MISKVFLIFTSEFSIYYFIEAISENDFQEGINEISDDEMTNDIKLNFFNELNHKKNKETNHNEIRKQVKTKNRICNIIN